MIAIAIIILALIFYALLEAEKTEEKSEKHDEPKR